ncbi:RNA polymerase sigma factor [Pedobacter nutrimenti]|uniref:RNA polymerase sigma-70 factor (ECF subfamily) n=1 Tax=Pedobacter nutrimenti TaxID=1241337 RepID=A0A318UYH5_9SPHI|nr:sigma-70 family RNA polymerase sigma factor [Pedobacter nutrimenti]PYF76639.1 RNA polymerase sigma-70 factor (ECF subfamily) [Pedobacter nutrimenti]
MKRSTDNHLMELIRKNDHRAFTLLVDRYWEDLYGHIRIKIREKDDAKDLVQDIFLGLWKNREQVSCNQQGSIAPYLFGAARYAVISYFSRCGVLVPAAQSLTVFQEPVSAFYSDEPYLLKELQSQIEHEVDSLPDRLKIPYRLSREQQLSIKEIASRLSLSEQTVKNNISAVLAKLRARLGQYHSDSTICLILAIATFFHDH